MTDGTTQVTVAAIQCELGGTRESNWKRIETLAREAHAKGAQIILPPELFDGPYFPQKERESAFAAAAPATSHPTVLRFSDLAKELGVVIPISFFERHGQHHFNSVTVADADGQCLGIYRKSHIPTGPGYQEKFYFRPGGTGFRVFDTRFAVIGVGICWDQWFPEAARAMALLGAELLFYPTAIGTEPDEPDLDTSGPWQRAMQGHAVCNTMPVIASNRIGTEDAIEFYGASFIANERGERVQSLETKKQGILTHRFDLGAIRRARASFGLFRDRRPELYGLISATDPGPSSPRPPSADEPDA